MGGIRARQQAERDVIARKLQVEIGLDVQGVAGCNAIVLDTEKAVCALIGRHLDDKIASVQLGNELGMGTGQQLHAPCHVPQEHLELHA